MGSVAQLVEHSSYERIVAGSRPAWTKRFTFYKTNQMLKGGIYIGKGSYGCAFSPPLKGVSQPQYDASKIGKVSLRDAAENELRDSHPFQTADPAGQFGIYPYPTAYKVDATQAQTSAGGLGELEKCFNRGSSGPLLPAISNLIDASQGRQKPPSYQLISDRAVTDLRTLYETLLGSVEKTPAMVEAHLRALGNLYRGIFAYHTGPDVVMHLDIKPENVVVMGTAEQPTAFKFIDFGLGCTAEQIETLPSKTDILQQGYYPFPLVANAEFLKFESGRYAYNGKLTETITAELKNVVAKRDAWAAAQLWYPNVDTLDRLSRHLSNLKHRYRDPSLAEPTDERRRYYTVRHCDVHALAVLTAYVYYNLTGTYFEVDSSGQSVVINSTPGEPYKALDDKIGPLIFNMIACKVKDVQLPDVYDQIVLSHFATP